jgi:hypothetical protein
MLAEATWLEIGFLWFQRFKRYGDQWQKGNASMKMHACRELESHVESHSLRRFAVYALVMHANCTSDRLKLTAYPNK